jgi:putative FmdB family regulatory protein
MPIYEFTCKSCDTKFEHLTRSMSENPKAPCPSCGSDKTARALSVFAVSSGSSANSAAAGDDAPMCGRCGGLPGSCQM